MIFLMVIGFSQVVWAVVCCTWCGGNFHGLLGSFNVLGGDLGRWFCTVVSVPVFLYEFQEMVKVLDRFIGVVSSLIAFPGDQESVPVVLAVIVEYLLCFPFICIVD